MKLTSFLTPYIKINSKWLRLKEKISKTLRRNSMGKASGHCSWQFLGNNIQSMDNKLGMVLFPS
jgi:hypothetical protein